MGVLGALGGLLGASWALLAASWGVFGPSWGLLGASWDVLGDSWRVLGASGRVLGASWRVLARKTTPNINLTDMGTGSAVLFGSSLWQPLGVIFPPWIYLEASSIACFARFARCARLTVMKKKIGCLLGSLGSFFQWRRVVSNGFGHAP